MADKLTPSTAPLPTCCASPVLGINETTGTCVCGRCGAKHTWDGKAWVKPAEPKPAK